MSGWTALNDTPPNNWLSVFGHSAWQWDDMRKQYYYHAFYKQQPDLNWRNHDVRAAMYNMIRGWMKRGVAGFRLDAVPQLFEDPERADEKLLPGVNSYGDRYDGAGSHRQSSRGA